MRIETPSRLHLGIIDLSRKFVREYGALGLTIKGGFEIEVTQAEKELDIDASKRNEEEIKKIYDKLESRFDLSSGYKIRVRENIPRHVGLGSTTQLNLGTAKAILELENISIDIRQLAKITGRARYSAIGTYGFEYGGFILEGGKINTEEIPPLTFRADIPEDWRFVVICSEEMEGYDEEEERPIMDDLEINDKFPEEICHQIVMGVLPSLKTKDISNFGYHVSQIQRLVGKSFSDCQGGEFHPAVADIIEKLNELTYGIGQSSWGPTVYGITTDKEANDVKNKMEDWLRKEDKNVRIWIAEPNNSGARIID